MQVRNAHERLLPASIEKVRPWIERAWSGTGDDVFPHDRLMPWRRAGSEGARPSATEPLKFGHANLRFALRRWDGTHWEADVLSRTFRGRHSFTLAAEGSATRVRHVLEGTLHGTMRLLWPLAIRPLHDWAIEALFDRLEHAVRTGVVPSTTVRPMSAYARAVYTLLDRPGRGLLSGTPSRAPNNWGTTGEEMLAAFPCDALIVPPDERLFRAVTVRAPVAEVFRWLCQLRVAPYSYDWLDNGGRRSPRQITPGLEDLAVGQRVMRIFRIDSFARNRHLTLRLTGERARRWFGEAAVTYALVDHGAETRLVAKIVVRHRRSALGKVMRRLLAWGDLVMMRKQMRTLKELAERHAGATAT